MLHGLSILVVTFANALHIIFVIQGRDRPSVRVLSIEETDLHHDPSLSGLDDEIFQPREILRITLVEVKLVPAEQVARLVAPGPRHDQAPWFGTEWVTFDEFSLGFEHCARVDP